MTSDNYPPGVSGHEWQIAGSDGETRIGYMCNYCDWDDYIDVEFYGSEWWGTCPQCGIDVAGTMDEWIDPDY